MSMFSLMQNKPTFHAAPVGESAFNFDAGQYLVYFSKGGNETQF